MRTKRKSESHIIEKQSLSIIARLLPEFWTIREYRPDYGLDLSIELFEKKQKGKNVVYDTLGEHLLIQVKGVRNVKIKKLIVNERNNIENNPIKEGDKYSEMNVIKYSIDTIELRTIQRMGSAIPVLLFVVDTTNESLHFICLNDYVDKIIIPVNPNYFEQKSITINIPVDNEINSNPKSLLPLSQIFMYSAPLIHKYHQRLQ